MKPAIKKEEPTHLFHSLSFKEVFRCIKELGIKVAETDFKDPLNPDLILGIYERFVDIFMDLDRKDYAQPIQEIAEQLEFPELHMDSVPKLVSLHNIFRFMRAIGVWDFTINDILQPTRQKTITNFSGVINFCKFREGRIPLYQQLSAKTDELSEKKEELDQQNAVFQQELEVLRATRAEEEPAIQHVMKENEALGQRIVQLNASQEEITSQNRTFKQTTTELQEKTSAIKLEIAEIRKESAYLRANIVESPEALKKTIDDLAQSIEKSRASIRQAELKQKQLNDEIAMLQKMEKELQKLNKMMEEAEAERAKSKELGREVKSMKGVIADNEEEIRQLRITETYLTRQVENAEDKYEKLRQQKKDKENISERSKEAAIAERAVILEENKNLRGQIDQTESTAREVQAQIELTKARHIEELTVLLDKYNALEQQLLSYHQRLVAAAVQ